MSTTTTLYRAQYTNGTAVYSDTTPANSNCGWSTKSISTDTCDTLTAASSDCHLGSSDTLDSDSMWNEGPLEGYHVTSGLVTGESPISCDAVYFGVMDARVGYHLELTHEDAINCESTDPSDAILRCAHWAEDVSRLCADIDTLRIMQSEASCEIDHDILALSGGDCFVANPALAECKAIMSPEMARTSVELPPRWGDAYAMQMEA